MQLPLSRAGCAVCPTGPCRRPPLSPPPPHTHTLSPEPLHPPKPSRPSNALTVQLAIRPVPRSWPTRVTLLLPPLPSPPPPPDTTMLSACWILSVLMLVSWMRSSTLLATAARGAGLPCWQQACREAYTLPSLLPWPSLASLVRRSRSWYREAGGLVSFTRLTYRAWSSSSGGWGGRRELQRQGYSAGVAGLNRHCIVCGWHGCSLLQSLSQLLVRVQTNCRQYAASVLKAEERTP